MLLYDQSAVCTAPFGEAACIGYIAVAAGWEARFVVLGVFG